MVCLIILNNLLGLIVIEDMIQILLIQKLLIYKEFSGVNIPGVNIVLNIFSY